MCSLLILSLSAAKSLCILFYIVVFCRKALVMHPKCVYNKSNKSRTENYPCLFILPFLLNFVTILLRILLIFCKRFVIRRRTAYEHTV